MIPTWLPRGRRAEPAPPSGDATAFDLWFESGDGVARHPSVDPTQPRPTIAAAGWIGSAGPGLSPEQWPRGVATGLPMFHAVTLLLPPSFQRHGPGLPAVAFFQGEGQFASARPDSAERDDDPFIADIARCADHPQMCRRSDIIDGQFALVRLTQEEFDAGPTPPPVDSRRPGEHVATDEGPNAWDTLEPVVRVWLLERRDPNAGRPPVDVEAATGAPGYTSPYDERFGLRPWAQELASSHLGGTAFPVQTLVPGLTPFYLELEELPGLNFGGGNAQIDLESDAFDWACG